MAPLKRAIADDTGSEALKHLRIDDGQPIKAQAPQQNTDNLHSEPSDSESDQDMDAADHVADAYLDTVNRSSLDFDFEQLCSVSLATSNVYACLVCGKYYQGRGKQTHAYFHSINDDHHVFINLTTLAVYVLPENYEVADRSLNDIKDVIRPLYTTGDIARLDAETRTLHDLAGSSYVPGFVGLNRIKSNSYMNVILQLVAHISPIRDSLLLAPNNDRASALVRKLSALVRQMWHTRRFKAHVSPHECVQEVVALSKRRFGLDVECDPFELLVWMLNAVHIGLGGGSKPKSKRGSIVYKTFRGEMCVTTQALGDTQVRTSEDAPLQIDMEKSTEVATSPFLALSLELPPKPLFTSTVSAGNNDEDDEDGRADIPQVALTTLLERYDGSMAVEVNGLARQYQVTQLPPFVICHVKRFSTRGFLAEKNPTVVNYAVRNVPFGQLLPEHAHAERAATYDLVVNVCHVGNHVPKSSAQSSGNSGAPDVPTEDVGSAAESPFVAFVRHASNKWFKLHDLQVEPIMPQMMFLADSYIQVWQRNDS